MNAETCEILFFLVEYRYSIIWLLCMLRVFVGMLFYVMVFVTCICFYLVVEC